MSAQQRTTRGPSKAHGLKEHRQKMAERQAKRQDKQKQKQLIEFGVRAAVTIMAVLVVAAGVYVAFFADNVVFIDPKDDVQLKDVFLSGAPWVVGCAEGKSGKAPKVLSESTSLLASRGIRAGVIDCSASLPSGKSTLKRFKLQDIKGSPTIMVVANGKKPIQIMPGYMKTSKLLASFAVAKTKLQRHYPTSNTQFQTLCARKSNCVIVAANRALSSQQEAIINAVADKRRKTSFVHVNPFKAQLNLGLKGTKVKELQQEAEPTLIFLHRATGSNTTQAKVHAGTFPSASEFLKLVDETASNQGLSSLKYAPAIRALRTNEKASSKSKPNPKTTAKTPASKAEPTDSFEDDEMVKERERRLRMEQQDDLIRELDEDMDDGEDLDMEDDEEEVEMM
eukprot:m.58542 g.58542  ORF g.58542 m.58542 type:complete len:395 (-) comp13770_c0_seq1:43-1227(-)